MTVADPSEPGLYAKEGSWYYSSISDELLQNTHGHPRALLPSSHTLFPSSKSDVTAEVVKAGLEATAIIDPATDEKELLLTNIVSRHALDFATITERVFPKDAPY